MEAAREKDGDAEYLSGYLYMTLPFRAKPLKDYTIHELGSYVHEYVHFLQNVTTPWGLYESARMYERISHYFAQLHGYKDEPILFVPDKEVYAESHRELTRILDLGRGTDKDNNGMHVSNLRFTDRTEFKHHRILEQVGNRKIPKIELEFSTQSHGRRRILFGAWSIKESMAAMIQEKIDPDSQSRHDDVPYKSVERYCAEVFPDIARDKDKMIAICYASLFSLSPAQTFIDLASHANCDSSLSADAILTGYFRQNKVTCNGELVEFEDFCKNLSAKLLTILSKMAPFELKYIPAIVRANLFRKGNYPLLWFCDPNLNRELVGEFQKASGVPVVLGTEDSSILPQLEDDVDSLQEIIWLMGIETLYKYLTKGYCPRFAQCEEIGKTSHSCHNTPWRRDDACPMTEMAAVFGLSDKNVIRSN